ncbi:MULTISPECIES: hypothetical protein [unclassified Streptomyces]|nr:MULTISPECIES: hypothetical protein [unclassified Streptomyces]
MIPLAYRTPSGATSENPLTMALIAVVVLVIIVAWSKFRRRK